MTMLVDGELHSDSREKYWRTDRNYDYDDDEDDDRGIKTKDSRRKQPQKTRRVIRLAASAVGTLLDIPPAVDLHSRLVVDRSRTHALL